MIAQTHSQFSIRRSDKMTLSPIKLRPLPNACPEIDDINLARVQTIQLFAAIPSGDAVTLKPGNRTSIPTGISVELPENWEAQVIPLPSIAMENGITVLNSPGTIDPDYRGEIQVILINHGNEEFTIRRGTAIAHLKFAPFERVTLVETDKLSSTKRGKSGLGSTGD